MINIFNISYDEIININYNGFVDLGKYLIVNVNGLDDGDFDIGDIIYLMVGMQILGFKKINDKGDSIEFSKN